MSSKEAIKKTRSEIMRAVRSKNTGPEWAVRKMVYSLGYRYRLHRKDLPGSPDLVFLGRKKVIFVHGCFWHGHDCHSGKNLPASNLAYWEPKLSRNKQRDAENQAALKIAGWKFMIIWECQLKERAALTERVAEFLKS